MMKGGQKKMLNEIKLETGNTCKWMTEVQKAKNEMNITDTSNIKNNKIGKAEIKRKLQKLEEDNWKREIEGKESMQWYSKDKLKGVSRQLLLCEEKRIAFQIRTGCLIIEDREIECCGKNMQGKEIIEHVILECRNNEEERKYKLEEKIEEWREKGIINNTEKMKNICRTYEGNIWSKVKELIKLWKEARKNAVQNNQ